MCQKVVIKLAQKLENYVCMLKTNTIIMYKIIKTRFLTESSNQGIISSLKPLTLVIDSSTGSLVVATP